MRGHPLRQRSTQVTRGRGGRASATTTSSARMGRWRRADRSGRWERTHTARTLIPLASMCAATLRFVSRHLSRSRASLVAVRVMGLLSELLYRLLAYFDVLCYKYGENSHTIGIHVCGNFEIGEPTSEQIESLPCRCWGYGFTF